MTRAVFPSCTTQIMTHQPAVPVNDSTKTHESGLKYQTERAHNRTWKFFRINAAETFRSKHLGLLAPECNAGAAAEAGPQCTT